MCVYIYIYIAVGLDEVAERGGEARREAARREEGDGLDGLEGGGLGGHLGRGLVLRSGKAGGGAELPQAVGLGE